MPATHPQAAPSPHVVHSQMCASCRESDPCNNQMLESNAWNVITVWECELNKAHL